MLTDLFIPVALVAAVATMMFPLHPAVMDFLLVVNLVLALGLLISALYIGDSLKLSALPSMLLLATLFRLALNVSSTRLILGRGEGGQMIEAFGKVAIQGNVVVGLVVFLIITLIQFIVIAKGSERVAEVSARFTLDALPGKQMSIDADVRAGLIDFEIARGKREELQTESRFYGALDGAMKFIKGDAIAGMVIIAVNIVGGILVGLAMQGLPIEAALQKYTVLSVGEGLVSQIPALLNALAAGMVVTRVSRGGEAPLAREVVQQLVQLPHVRALLGVFTLVMACMPGMPTFAFVTLGVLCAGSAVVSWGRRRERERVAAPRRFQPRALPLLCVEVTRGQLLGLQGPAHLPLGLEQFREQTFERWGLVLALPDIEIAADFAQGFRLRMRGIALEHVPTAAAGLELLGAIQAALGTLVAGRIAEFIDDVVVRRTLDYYEREAPELVTGVVPAVAGVTQLSELFKGLVREGIPVRNLDLILQAVAEVRPKPGSERLLLEEVRIALRRLICSQHVNDQGELRIVTLSPLIDVAFAKAEREGKSFNPAQVEAVVHGLQALSSKASRAILLVSRGARRLMRECLNVRKVNMPVLCFEEIVDEIKLTPVGNIDYANDAAELSDEGLAELAA